MCGPFESWMMGKLFLVSTIVGLLVYSISGLLPLKYAPHDHLLIGPVTAEQLRAHQLSESFEAEQAAQVSTSFATPNIVNGSRGIIISTASPLAGLLAMLHVEIDLQFAILLFIPFLYYSISIFRLVPHIVTLPSPDPPPRPFYAPI